MALDMASVVFGGGLGAMVVAGCIYLPAKWDAFLKAREHRNVRMVEAVPDYRKKLIQKIEYEYYSQGHEPTYNGLVNIVVSVSRLFQDAHCDTSVVADPGRFILIVGNTVRQCKIVVPMSVPEGYRQVGRTFDLDEYNRQNLTYPTPKQVHYIH